MEPACGYASFIPSDAESAKEVSRVFPGANLRECGLDQVVTSEEARIEQRRADISVLLHLDGRRNQKPIAANSA
jgi:hypothetical protein